MKAKLDVINVNEKAGKKQEQEQMEIRRRQRERMRAKKLERQRKRRKQLIRLAVSVVMIVLLVSVIKNMGKKNMTVEVSDRQKQQSTEETEATYTLVYEVMYPEFYKHHTPEVLKEKEIDHALKELAEIYTEFEAIYEERDKYPDKLLSALCNNPEMLSYVEGYLKYESGDKTVAGDAALTSEEKEQRFPLFLQWDKRWGYEAYGDFNIALSGCGPTCLSMVLVALNHDYDMTPKKVADFAMKNGFYVEGTGTAWSLMTEGAKELGLSAKEVSLDEYVMKNQLDAGKMLICSVGPGDFTAQGHFIVIYDYDEHGFRINDPNCVYRSSKSWSYREIASQIKILWAYGKNE